MSRFIAKTKNGQEMAFGYDRPLQEYFVQVYDDENLIFDINSSGMSMVDGGSTTPNSNSNIYKFIKNTMSDADQELYKNHLEDLLLDLPF